MTLYRLGSVCSEVVNSYVMSATLISAFQQTKTFQLIVFQEGTYHTLTVWFHLMNTNRNVITTIYVLYSLDCNNGHKIVYHFSQINI